MSDQKYKISKINFVLNISWLGEIYQKGLSNSAVF